MIEELLNSTINQKIIMNNQEKEKFVNLLNNSLNSIQTIEENYEKELNNNVDSYLYEPSLRKKHFDNSLLFYNSLSLIMLAMLTGGLIGVIFIMFFSFKSEDK